MKLRHYCQRCGRRKTKDFMVLTKTGYPDKVCLDCEAHDRIKREQYARERQERPK